MKLSSLLKDTAVSKIVGDTDRDMKGICYDSRKVKPGYVFVCIVGFETDGHKYIAGAISAGASAIVVQEGAKLPDIPETITLIVAKKHQTSACAAGGFLLQKPAEKA